MAKVLNNSKQENDHSSNSSDQNVEKYPLFMALYKGSRMRIISVDEKADALMSDESMPWLHDYGADGYDDADKACIERLKGRAYNALRYVTESTISSGGMIIFGADVSVDENTNRRDLILPPWNRLVVKSRSAAAYAELEMPKYQPPEWAVEKNYSDGPSYTLPEDYSAFAVQRGVFKRGYDLGSRYGWYYNYESTFAYGIAYDVLSRHLSEEEVKKELDFFFGYDMEQYKKDKTWWDTVDRDFLADRERKAIQRQKYAAKRSAQLHNIVGTAKEYRYKRSVNYLVDAQFDVRDPNNLRSDRRTMYLYLDKETRYHACFYSKEEWDKIVEGGTVVETSPGNYEFAAKVHLESYRNKARHDTDDFYRSWSIDTSQPVLKSDYGVNKDMMPNQRRVAAERAAKWRAKRLEAYAAMDFDDEDEDENDDDIDITDD